MKKNHSIICLVQVILASTLLLPFTAYSQDLTAEQKQERCENNKNRIAELEGQLRIINTELSTAMSEKEIEDERTNMKFLRHLEKESNSWETEAIRKDVKVIAGRHSYIGCISLMWDECIKELGDLIAKKIDKAMLMQNKSPALINKKTEIDKQIASHRNNLITLGCDANNIANTPDISGTWKALKWNYEFTQIGKKFSWKITNDAAYGEKADGEFLVGNRIKATWTNKNGQDSGEGTVTVENGRVIQINWDNKVNFTRN